MSNNLTPAGAFLQEGKSFLSALDLPSVRSSGKPLSGTYVNMQNNNKNNPKNLFYWHVMRLKPKSLLFFL